MLNLKERGSYMKEIVERLLGEFSTRIHKDRPLIVAIDGLSGAGKTTLVKKLEHELTKKSQVIVIHIDDHIVERNKRYETGHEEWYEYYYLQWDIAMLTKTLFQQLHKTNSTLVLPFYDLPTDTISIKDRPVPADSIVLIEGIFLQRKEWRHYYDFIIFLNCPRETRYERALNRDVYIGDYEARLSKYKRRYWPGEEHYLNTESPLENANKIYTS